MVRQYKIHTNLDGTDDKVWDVTNGKVRFYQPSNLGLQSTNNIWQSNGIGVMGTRSITQPQIEFKLETFGESLEENYQLMKDFINDILNQKFVTFEYQTEIFQVYADLALADVTKTEGYGKNGTFSEKITFDIITKWYTYENLTFEMIQNGKVIAGKSKIHGGYKGSETALQNYNRLKSSPSLNLPNLNLLDGTKDFSGDWIHSSGLVTDGTYKGLTVKKRVGQWGGIYKTFTAPKSGVYTFSAYVKSSGSSANITRYVETNTGHIIPEKFMGNNFDWLRDSFSVVLKAKDTIYTRYEISGSGSDSILWTAGHKWEEIMPITEDFTTIYPNFNLLDGTKDFSGYWEGMDGWQTDGTYKGLVVKRRTYPWGGIYKTFTAPKDGTYTFSAYVKSAGNTANIYRLIFKNDINVLLPNKELGSNFDWTRDSFTLTLNAGDVVYAKYEMSGAGELWTAGHKCEEGTSATTWTPSEKELQNQYNTWFPSATEVTTADIREYFGYNYIANQAYTYYGETNIDRLSRWDIKDEIFSFMGILYPQLSKTPTGVRFLDDIGNEYTAIVFKTEELQDYILINTDVNDETYQGWKGTTALNLFPVMDFERHRTRIIEKGQMELINLSKAEFKVKRKADFV